jgi:WXG100 family type VII secretion target
MGLGGPIGSDPQQLQQAKTEFFQAASDFEGSVAKVRAAIEKVNATWFGHTNQLVNTRQEDWNKNMQLYNNGVKSIGDALGVTGLDYVTLDTPSAGSGA